MPVRLSPREQVEAPMLHPSATPVVPSAVLGALSGRSAALCAALCLGACAKEVSLEGSWSGTLVCDAASYEFTDEDGEPYTVEVASYDVRTTLSLEAPNEDRIYRGLLESNATYEADDSRRQRPFLYETLRAYDVELTQKYGYGQQGVELVEVCGEARVTVDGDVISDTCEEVDDPGGIEVFIWDGEDELAVQRTTCAGALSR